MTGRLAQLLVLVLLAGALAAPAAWGQATGATGADGSATVVEPKAGTPAPAPVDPATTTTPPAATVAPAPQTTTAAPVPAAGATGTTGPQGAKATGKGGLSNAAIALIAGGALLLALIGLLAFAQWRGWSSRRLARWRHAAAEANWRLGLRAAEFRDFLRLGR